MNSNKTIQYDDLTAEEQDSIEVQNESDYQEYSEEMAGEVE